MQDEEEEKHLNTESTEEERRVHREGRTKRAGLKDQRYMEERREEEKRKMFVIGLKA